MTTLQRAGHIAAAAAGFRHLLGDIRAGDLLEFVKAELGHEGILDNFECHGTHKSLAIPLASILHIISGNTPHAGLQSLIRGLVLGSHNFCKLPSTGLPEIEAFRSALPPELAQTVELSHELPPDWFKRAEAVVVFGNDETVARFRGQVSKDQIFIAHGHKLGFGIVFDDPNGHSAAAAARDVSLFDQQGCVSPHVIYVNGDAEKYAVLLAEQMELFEQKSPRRELRPDEAAGIHALRNETEFRTAAGDEVRVFKSPSGTAWTVIYDADPTFTMSPLNRLVFVKPMPESFANALSSVRPFLSTVGIWPCTEANANRIAHLGASRVCPLGKMQEPPLTWHQDGHPQLAPLVKWVDLHDCCTLG